MRPIPKKYFGPSGLPCVFVANDTTGEMTVGWLVKQLSVRRYIVSDGTVTRVANLAQYPSEVANLASMPAGTFTIQIAPLSGNPEHVSRIYLNKCHTIEGNVHEWSRVSPTDVRGQITAPALSEWLLEDGTNVLLEDGTTFWGLEFSS